MNLRATVCCIGQYDLLKQTEKLELNYILFQNNEGGCSKYTLQALTVVM